jgi:hypothetical protein
MTKSKKTPLSAFRNKVTISRGMDGSTIMQSFLRNILLNQAIFLNMLSAIAQIKKYLQFLNGKFVTKTFFS